MSIEKQKADLLDEYITQLRSQKLITLKNEECNLIDDYEQIIQQKTLTADPYADEVFSGRLFKKVLWYFKEPLKDMPKLSDCPHISWFGTDRGFGRKSREEYIEVMKKFGFNDKI